MSESQISLNEPEWLDALYLEKILVKFTGNKLKEIRSFSKVPATKKGENYASAMYLITIEYTTTTTTTRTDPAEPEVETISVILKSRLATDLMDKIEEDFNIFRREAQVYTIIMQETEKLLKSIGDETRLAPHAPYVDDRIIVLENLKLRGYDIRDVKRGLDLGECRMVLEKLAKFHAASMVLYEKDADIFRHHMPGNVSKKPSPLHELYTNAIKSTIEYCKTKTELRSYVPKLEAFGENIVARMIGVFSRDQEDRFHVLNHGDLWVNNMMFSKPSTDRGEDVLLVDYQEGFFGSPGIDWNYFIFSSWQTQVFEHHFEDLILSYHQILSDVLQKLNYAQRIPTVSDVKKEISNKGFHGLATATCVLPILINEHTELADPANFLLNTKEAAENRRTIFNNSKFGKRLECFLKYFEENSIL